MCGRAGVASVMVFRGTEWRRPPAPVRATASSYQHAGGHQNCFETSNRRQQRARNRVSLSRAAIVSIDWADRLTRRLPRAQAERQIVMLPWCCKWPSGALVGQAATHTAHRMSLQHSSQHSAIRAGVPRHLRGSACSSRAATRGRRMAIIDTHLSPPQQPTTILPLLISFVQGLQPRPRQAVGEQI